MCPAARPAAVIAARLAPASLGSDTGGSIRQPASHCGITGLKPTYGTVSRFGMIAYASSLDQAGPMAQTAEDCAILLNAMAGFDERDSTSLERENEDYTRDLNRPLKGLKIGLPKEYFGDGCEADVKTALHNTIAILREQGAETVEVSLPQTALSIPAYYVLASAEASTNLSRYDGVRYGHRAAEFANLEEMYANTRAEGFGSEVKRRIMIGTYVLSHGYYDAYYIKAQKLRRLVANDFQTAFADCDLILGPTAPSSAPQIGSHGGDPLACPPASAATACPSAYSLLATTFPKPACSTPSTKSSLPATGIPKRLRCKTQTETDWMEQSSLKTQFGVFRLLFIQRTGTDRHHPEISPHNRQACTLAPGKENGISRKKCRLIFAAA